MILYELLAGRMPYTISKKLHEAMQAIREQDPARLSSVNRSYRGDIETIVAKALEKDKTRRYASAAELAADIGRYLKDEPIIARPPSATYQLQKFARRHTGLVVGIIAVGCRARCRSRDQHLAGKRRAPRTRSRARCRAGGAIRRNTGNQGAESRGRRRRSGAPGTRSSRHRTAARGHGSRDCTERSVC